MPTNPKYDPTDYNAPGEFNGDDRVPPDEAQIAGERARARATKDEPPPWEARTAAASRRKRRGW